MKIKEILSQNRRDFTAIYKCEHCEHTHQGNGYDDSNFHNNVIPMMKCPECGETGHKHYRPLTTKYKDGEVI